MPAANLNLIIQQGETWGRTLTWKNSAGTPYDLTGYTARMQIRLTADSATPIIELNTSPTAAQGTITLGGVAGTIGLLLSSALSAGMSFAGASIGTVQEGTDTATGQLGVYDLDLTNGTVVTTLARGTVCFVKEVTR